MIPCDLTANPSRERILNIKKCPRPGCDQVATQKGHLDERGFFERVEIVCPKDGIVYWMERGRQIPDIQKMPAAICR